MEEKQEIDEKKSAGILERFLPRKDQVSRDEFEAWKDKMQQSIDVIAENLRLTAELQIKQNVMQEKLQRQYSNAIVIKMEHEVRGMKVLVGDEK